MKATIDIPDVLYREAETRTASEGTTIDGVFVTLLGGWLESRGWRPEIKTEYVITDAPKPRPRRQLSFFGIARPGANLNVSHDWNDIKKSIEKGWAQEALEKEKRIGAL